MMFDEKETGLTDNEVRYFEIIEAMKDDFETLIWRMRESIRYEQIDYELIDRLEKLCGYFATAAAHLKEKCVPPMPEAKS